MRYIRYRPDTGRITQTGVCADDALEDQALDGDLVMAHETASYSTHWVDNGVATEYSPQAKEALANPPGAGFEWSPSAGAWIDQRALATVKADLVQQLKRARDTRLEGGFVWDGSPFDSDTAVSQPRLLGLFTTAVAGGIPPEGYPWRLKNNQWRVLSASDAIAVWGAFQSHMSGLFSAFAAHEATVLAETDIEVLRSYDTESGWP